MSARALAEQIEHLVARYGWSIRDDNGRSRWSYAATTRSRYASLVDPDGEERARVRVSDHGIVYPGSDVSVVASERGASPDDLVGIEAFARWFARIEPAASGEAERHAKRGEAARRAASTRAKAAGEREREVLALVLPLVRAFWVIGPVAVDRVVAEVAPDLSRTAQRRVRDRARWTVADERAVEAAGEDVEALAELGRESRLARRRLWSVLGEDEVAFAKLRPKGMARFEWAKR
jgi:hypothetical protein